MKILVITYSKEINPGTFLQAYGVQCALKSRFPNSDIVYINYDIIVNWRADDSVKIPIKNILISKYFGIIRRIKYLYLQSKIFKYEKIKFDFFKYDSKLLVNYLDSFDLLVVGSDTILEKLSEDNKMGLMWIPEEVKTPRVFFAASAGAVKFEVSEEEKYISQKMIERFTHIGLRDDLTIKLFKNTLGVEKTILKQPDPTFFLSNSIFVINKRAKVLLEKVRRERKKVLLYNFGKNFKFNRELSEFLKNQNYFLISTIYNIHSDFNAADVNPFEWGGLFSKVDLIVTERFHDTIFGLRNEKPVISIDWSKERFNKDGLSKTYNILSDYGLEKFHVNYVRKGDIEKVKEIIELVHGFSKKNIADINKSYVAICNDVLCNLKDV